MDLQAVERAASCKTCDIFYLGIKHHSVITKLPQCIKVGVNKVLVVILRHNIYRDISYC